MTAKCIIGIGDLNGDVIVPYGAMKQAVATIAQNRAADKIPSVSLKPGGSVANTCIALGKLGLHPVFLSKIGKDECSQYLLEELLRAGVETGSIIQQDFKAFLTLVVLDETGERTMFPWNLPGAKEGLFETGELSEDFCRKCSWIHTSGLALKGEGKHEKVLTEFVRACKKAGAKVSFDLNIRAESFGYTVGRRKIFEEMVRMSDVVFGSGLEELGVYTGLYDLEKAARAIAKECSQIIVRDGPNPVIAISKGQFGYYPVYPVRQLHTIGAGDAFNGGFIAASVKGMPFEQAVAWGNVCAAYTVSHEDALAIPDQKELDEMLAEYNKQLQGGK